MTSSLQQVVGSYNFMDGKYIIELFNTAYVLVSRKTDDGSTYTQSLRKTQRIHNGYTEILRLSNFEEYYDTPILDQIIELFENFIQHSELPVTFTTNPVQYDYISFDSSEGFPNFLIELLSKKDYSDLKKWCALNSAFTYFNQKIIVEEQDFVFNLLDQQVNPEKVTEWHSIAHSALYVFPDFPLSIPEDERSAKLDKVQDFRKIKKTEAYADYTTIINFLRNEKCHTLQDSENKGFVHYDTVLTEDETSLVLRYVSQKHVFKFLNDVPVEKMIEIQPYINRIPKINKELLPFVVNQILTTNLTGLFKYNSQRLYLNEFDYQAFLKITDRIFEEEQSSKIRKPTEFSYFEDLNDFNLWITMAKLFLENNVEEFSDFFREWMSLINEEKNDQLYHPVFIQENFQASLEDNLPVRYLYHLNA